MKIDFISIFCFIYIFISFYYIFKFYFKILEIDEVIQRFYDFFML